MLTAGGSTRGFRSASVGHEAAQERGENERTPMWRMSRFESALFVGIVSAAVVPIFYHLPAPDAGRTQNRFTEYRMISTPDEVPLSSTQTADIDLQTSTRSEPLTAVGLGDKVVLFFADTNKRLSARLFEDGEDLEKGRLSIHSALGRVVCSGEEGDEIEFSESGRARKVLIESVEKSLILEINSEIELHERKENPRPAAAVG
jgi:Transcription elongation factor, GreA/GreB, C-term